MRQLWTFAALGLGLGLLPATSAAQAPADPAPAPAAGAPAPVPPKDVPVMKAPAKVASVCPGKILPLSVGNTWTYASVQSPVPVPPGMQKLLPLTPQRIVITVTGAETANNETTVKLTEKVTYDMAKPGESPKRFDVDVDSAIVCSTKGKFDISPSSFFFAGEAGGYRGLHFTKLERKKATSLKLTNGKIGDQEWIEEIVGDYQLEAVAGSNAKLGSGHIELERRFTPQPLDNVRTSLGIFKNTEKLGITTTGRIAINDKHAPDGKPCVQKRLDPTTKLEVSEPSELCELPANWISQIWLADGFGIVQVQNSYAHMFQLVEVKIN